MSQRSGEANADTSMVSGRGGGFVQARGDVQGMGKGARQRSDLTEDNNVAVRLRSRRLRQTALPGAVAPLPASGAGGSQTTKFISCVSQRLPQDSIPARMKTLPISDDFAHRFIARER